MADINKLNKTNAAELDKRLEYFALLKAKRERWNSIWDELKKYVCPQTESNKHIFDSTSIWSREQLASGLQSLMVNPAMNWFTLKLEEGLGLAQFAEEQPLATLPEVKLWLEQLEQTVFAVFNNPAANFYNQMHEFFLNLAAYGTGIFYVEEEPQLPAGMFFRNINLRECYFEENRLGKVDSLYRLFTLSTKAAAAKWPEDKVLQDRAERAPDETIEILHMVIPMQGKRVVTGNNNVAYSSDYIELAERRILSSGAYSYFPFLVTRWIREEGEPYGYAPAHHVLPDIKLLNSLRQITLKVAQKQLDPPLLVPKDGYYLPLYTTPGSVNFYRNGMADKIVPLTGMENILPTELEQNQCRDAIHKAFYVDIFRMQKENKEMTAAEVQMRSEEQYRLMASQTGRIETELLSPLINIVYQILIKYNRLPEIEGLGLPETLRPEYVSQLTRAQKVGQLSAIQQVLDFFQRSGIAGTHPDIYDNLNFDECIRLFLELKGAPQSVLKSEQEVMQLRQQRKAMQMQAQMGQMPN